MQNNNLRNLTLLTFEYPPFRGGIGTYCAELAQAAAAQGHPVNVLAPRFPGVQQPAPAGVTLGLFPGGVFKHWYFPYALLLTLVAIFSAPKGRVLLAADWPFVAACGLLRRILPFSYRAMVHGSEILFFKRSKLLRLLTGNNPFHGAELIFANSAFTAGLLTSNYPQVDPAKVVVTYLGVDQFWLDNSTEGSAAEINAHLTSAGIPLDKKIVLSVGRIHPRKGQNRCMAALDRLPPGLRDGVVYVIVGQAVDADYEAELRAEAAAAKVQVVFTGAISNATLRAIYRKASLFCLPSQTEGTKVEGFGLVFLEAAGSSVPSVAVADAAVPEVVVDGETGLLVPRDDVTALASALQSLLENDKLRTKLGQQARARALTFTWTACAAATMKELNV